MFSLAGQWTTFFAVMAAWQETQVFPAVEGWGAVAHRGNASHMARIASVGRPLRPRRASVRPELRRVPQNFSAEAGLKPGAG